MHRSLVLASSLALAAALTGCSQQPNVPPPSTFDKDSRFGTNQTADFDVPPRQLLDRVKQVVTAMGLGVAHETKDTIVTGWEQHVGDFHIMRHWQERTRYRITVIPDTEDPMSRARLQVDEETQQRAAKVQDFENASYLKRPERAEQLLAKIKQQIPASTATPRSTTPRRTAPVQQPAMTITPDQAHWTEMTGAGPDAPEIATLHTDPSTGSVQSLIRAVRPAHIPPRVQSTGAAYTVIAGAVTFTVDGQRTDLSPGSFTYVPRGANLEIILPAGAMISATSEAP